MPLGYKNIINTRNLTWTVPMVSEQYSVLVADMAFMYIDTSLDSPLSLRPSLFAIIVTLYLKVDDHRSFSTYK